MEKPVITFVEGPVLTDLGGNLSTPIWRCCDGDATYCKFLGVYDWHYFYCSAQPDSAPALRPGAGQQLYSGPRPDKNCPYT